MPDDKVRVNTDRTAVVDQGYFWRLIDSRTPRGAKLQLIDRRLGVAVYGVYTGTGSWTHWAPLPKFGDSADHRAAVAGQVERSVRPRPPAAKGQTWK